MANSSKASTRSSELKKSAGSRKKDVPHVVSQNGGWAVRSSRSGRFVSAIYKDKSLAIDAGRRIARNSGSKALVHGPSGQVFQRSPVPSTISEATIRRAVRATSEKVTLKGSKKAARVGSKSSSKKKSSSQKK